MKTNAFKIFCHICVFLFKAFKGFKAFKEYLVFFSKYWQEPVLGAFVLFFFSKLLKDKSFSKFLFSKLLGGLDFQSFLLHLHFSLLQGPEFYSSFF